MNIFKCPEQELISLCNAVGRMPALGQCHRPYGFVGQSLWCSPQQLAGGLIWDCPGCSSPTLAHTDLVTGAF